ncbi:hypothetical protein NPIL_202411 [Nephila pilipes]|uniref:Reverse transcriptase domain-containing protein n=1 Tax=Nephila pilipes TaxID=299642 RepID=A0A8X6MK08_NEPPI|nr:hypothetical protein NPIL_202411 [Nephila pilipes]
MFSIVAIGLLLVILKFNLFYAGWTGPITMKAGVRQGSPLSAILFNLSLEQILRTGVSAPGYHLYGHELKCLAYADDLLLLSDSSLALQQNIDYLQCRGFGRP